MSSRRYAVPGTPAALREDLAFAADKRLPQMFKDVAADRKTYPTLARVIEIIEPELWREDPTRALLVVMRRAVIALPEEAAWEFVSEDCTLRQVGRLLFFGSEVNSSLHKYGDYLAKVKEISGRKWTERDSNRLTNSVRERLAVILLDMEREAVERHEQSPMDEAVDGQPVSTADAEDQTPYVSRPDLAEAFEALWSTPATDWHWLTTRRVCLIGDAGTGKTRFVREHAAADHPHWIDADDDEPMLADMIDLLERYDHDTTGLDPSIIKRRFGQLLVRPDGPSLVIIDGIADPETLDQFLPRKTHTKLIITSRKLPTANWAPVLLVDDLTLNQAAELVVTLLPHVSPEEYDALAEIFGRRPLLIEHGCAFIKRDGTKDIREFCNAMNQDMALATDAMSSKTDRGLTAIYRHYLKRLGQEAPDSVRLLELLAFVLHQCVPPEYVMSYLLDVPYIKRDMVRRAQFAYEAAVKPLEALSLVRLKPGYGIMMSPLTQGILRGLLAGRVEDIARRAAKLDKIDRSVFYREGWHALTVAGREACNRVLLAHARDALLDGGNLTREGEIGGVRWRYLMAALWQRYLSTEFVMLTCEQWMQDHESFGWHWADGLLASKADHPRLQQEEAGEVMTLWQDFVKLSRAKRALAPVQQLSDRERADRVISALLSLTPRYMNSPLGELDFAIVNAPGGLSKEQIEQARQDMYAVLDEEGFGQ